MVSASAIWSLVSKGKVFDESLEHMFTKMMIAYINVLGPRAKLRKPC